MARTVNVTDASEKDNTQIRTGLRKIESSKIIKAVCVKMSAK